MKTLKLNVFAAGLICGVATFSGSLLAKEVKVGLMLPFTGSFAGPGKAIDNGFRLFVEQQGGKLGGREVKYFVVDDESDPAKATENANKLVKRDEIDVLVGTAHSGVALAMAKVARDTKTLMIIPNAGADELTGALCAPNIFRVSFSAWQPAYAMGKTMAEKGHKRAVTLAWKYSFGEQSVDAFSKAFGAAGGQIAKHMTLSFPNVEFQPFLTEIASLKPDAVYVFFAGAGAAKFVKDYEAAGLRGTIPLYSSGFLTDGTLDAMGGAGEGLYTTLHYADDLKSPRDLAFRSAYAAKYGIQPDVYAVQGYDSAQLLKAGLEAVTGGKLDQPTMIKAMETASVDSPRGEFTLSKAHNPVQDIYLRKVEGKQNKVVGVVAPKLADPAIGCRM